MSKRLQVLLDEPEWREIQRAARAGRLTVSEWVRQALRAARARAPIASGTLKIEVIRRAARLDFPTADIEQMLAEIEQGYLPPRVP
jgi:Ribbon-helix-helix protein, copG family